MKIYTCIDLKSFYASVECQERGLDPLTTNLVVADSSRTSKTICLAVSPSLKQYGLPGRARLFEVEQKVREINYKRKKQNYYKPFKDKSTNINELMHNKSLELDFIKAKPQMAKYIKYSTDIYNIYLKYLSKDDIYVYSIDEVFCDLTNYLKCYNKSPRELVTKIIHDVYETTGITAAAGIGTNLYLSKVAMDIMAKHAPADKYGVRIAGLTEQSYREHLWTHQPLTDFWRVGPGYAKKLEENNLYTMGDVALCSKENEELLYKLFGVNAEILIDHAWGWESCTIKDIKNYKPKNNCLTSGQVLHCAYDYQKTKLVIKEMIDLLSQDLVSKHLVTNQIVLTLGYDIIKNNDYIGPLVTDHYGRKIPKPAHGTINLPNKTSSFSLMKEEIVKLYDQIVNKKLLIKRINIALNNITKEEEAKTTKIYKQFDLFTDVKAIEEEQKQLEKKEADDKKIQSVIVSLKKKYGKNTILKGMNLSEGATTLERNQQIGGHHE